MGVSYYSQAKYINTFESLQQFSHQFSVFIVDGSGTTILPELLSCLKKRHWELVLHCLLIAYLILVLLKKFVWKWLHYDWKAFLKTYFFFSFESLAASFVYLLASRTLSNANYAPKSWVTSVFWTPYVRFLHCILFYASSGTENRNSSWIHRLYRTLICLACSWDVKITNFSNFYIKHIFIYTLNFILTLYTSVVNAGSIINIKTVSDLQFVFLEQLRG